MQHRAWQVARQCCPHATYLFRIRIHICISFKRRRRRRRRHVAACCKMAFAARQQNGGGVNGSCFSATHQINCKLFEQKLQQPQPRGTPSPALPETAAKTSSSRCSCYVCCMQQSPPYPPPAAVLRGEAVLNLWQHLCVVSRAR